MKSGHVVFDVIPADRHTDRPVAILRTPSRGEINITEFCDRNRYVLNEQQTRKPLHRALQQHKFSPGCYLFTVSNSQNVKRSRDPESLTMPLLGVIFHL